MVSVFQESIRIESKFFSDLSLNVILGGAPRTYFTSRPLKSLALLSMKPLTSGKAPSFQLQISRVAASALTPAAESSTSSVQQLLHSLTNSSSLTASSSLSHLEHTKVSEKPSSLHPAPSFTPTPSATAQGLRGYGTDG